MKVLFLVLATIAYMNYMHKASLQVLDSLGGLRSVYEQPTEWANQHLASFDKL